MSATVLKTSFAWHLPPKTRVFMAISASEVFYNFTFNISFLEFKFGGYF